jgi:hypothetical protein
MDSNLIDQKIIEMNKILDKDNFNPSSLIANHNILKLLELFNITSDESVDNILKDLKYIKNNPIKYTKDILFTMYARMGYTNEVKQNQNMKSIHYISNNPDNIMSILIIMKIANEITDTSNELLLKQFTGNINANEFIWLVKYLNYLKNDSTFILLYNFLLQYLIKINNKSPIRKKYHKHKLKYII